MESYVQSYGVARIKLGLGFRVDLLGFGGGSGVGWSWDNGEYRVLGLG